MLNVVALGNTAGPCWLSSLYIIVASHLFRATGSSWSCPSIKISVKVASMLSWTDSPVLPYQGPGPHGHWRLPSGESQAALLAGRNWLPRPLWVPVFISVASGLPRTVPAHLGPLRPCLTPSSLETRVGKAFVEGLTRGPSDREAALSCALGSHPASPPAAWRSQSRAALSPLNTSASRLPLGQPIGSCVPLSFTDERSVLKKFSR